MLLNTYWLLRFLNNLEKLLIFFHFQYLQMNSNKRIKLIDV